MTELTAPIADVEAAEPEDAYDAFVCSPCQRRQHLKCRSPECTCCGPDQE